MKLFASLLLIVLAEFAYGVYLVGWETAWMVFWRIGVAVVIIVGWLMFGIWYVERK